MNPAISAPAPRLGLCCIFRDEPIKFSTTTAAALGRMQRSDALAKLSRLCLSNADALMAALRFCAAHGIACFRVNSQILPIKTHPEQGYELDQLPDAAEIVRRFRACGEFARANGLRSCFHPDQFIVLNSNRPEVVASSRQEIEYQAEVCEWIGADVINIHGGAAFGNKPAALETLARNIERLSPRARSLLTVENDDRIFTPADLFPWCRREGVPLVYDVHHHRCLPDGLSIDEATELATTTWNRIPLFHISSPLEGWDGPKPRRHHDFIDPRDFPDGWIGKTVIVEVEAKAKEVAVLRLMRDLRAAALKERLNGRSGTAADGET